MTTNPPPETPDLHPLILRTQPWVIFTLAALSSAVLALSITVLLLATRA